MTENSRYYDKSTANDARIRIFIVYKCTKTSSRTSLILNTPPCTTLSRHYDLLSNTGRHSTASAPRYERVCSLLRTNQLPDTTASAPRCGRAWDGVRRQVVNLDSLAACWGRSPPSTPYINNKQALNIALSACLLLLCGKHVPSRRLVPAEQEPYYFLWASTQRRALTKASIHGVTSSARRSAG